MLVALDQLSLRCGPAANVTRVTLACFSVASVMLWIFLNQVLATFSSFCRFSKNAMHPFAGTNARGHDGSIFDGTQSRSNFRNMNTLVHSIKYCNHKYIVYPGMHRTWNWNLTFDYISEPLRNWRIGDRITRFAGEVQNRIQTIRPRRLDIQCHCMFSWCSL